MRVSATTVQQTSLRGKVCAIRATVKLLYEMDQRAFLISTSTGVIESLFYPLLLLMAWKGLSLFTATGGQVHDPIRVGALLLAGFFCLLALRQLLQVVSDTATKVLQAVSAQQTNARVMCKMAEIPYWLFEENDFQARYGLVMSQASFRPSMLVQSFISSLSALVSLLGIAATLIVLAPPFVVLLLVLIPLTLVESRFHRRTLGLQLDSAPDLFRMMYLSQRSIDATWQRDIRVHNSTVLDDEYRVLAGTYLRNFKRLMRRFQFIRGSVGLLVSVAITFSTAAIFWLATNSSAGIAAAAILLPALYLGLSQGGSFAFSWGGLVECLGYIEQVFDFLNQSFDERMPASELLLPGMFQSSSAPGVIGSAAEYRPAPRTLAVDLQTVCYNYPHTAKVALSNVSYTFTGGTTAIVGPNGAGKSTLVKLLTGLLTPTSGIISVRLSNGTCLTPAQLRKGVLFQEPSHLYLTIRQNITMRFDSIGGVDEDEPIWAALEAAGIGRAVRLLPDGLDTLVGAGFGGQTDLSGGQWQRLALARLIYQDAPLIILDEPVASLDPQGERAIFDLFAEMGDSKIIIFTTHRYDSIPKDTRIVVLSDGRIRESGTHDELLAVQRHYWTLYMANPQRRPASFAERDASMPHPSSVVGIR